MKQHNGMRPQDVIILLKIASLDNFEFRLIDLCQSLSISLSEVSDSITRSTFARLIAPDKKTLLRKALFEFLVHGLPYVFPAVPGALVVGLPTAYSAEPLVEIFGTADPLVWADTEGSVKGQEIPSFHPNQSYAARLDPALYALLALVDTLRIGRAREKRAAEVELEKRILL